jgi:hypothetical protein
MSCEKFVLINEDIPVEYTATNAKVIPAEIHFFSTIEGCSVPILLAFELNC